MIMRDENGVPIARCGYVEGGEGCANRAVDALSDIRLCRFHLWHARCEIENQEYTGRPIHWTTMKPDPLPPGCVAGPGDVARPLQETAELSNGEGLT